MKLLFCILFAFSSSLSADLRQTLQPFVPPEIRVLDTKTAVHFHDARFEDFVQWMNTRVGWNVAVRWHALEMIGVKRDSRFSLGLVNVSVRTVLNEVFRQLSRELAYELNRERIVISSRADFASNLIIKAYDMTDLVASFTRVNEPPPKELRDILQVKQDPPLTEEEARCQIQDLIESLSPDMWMHSGGESELIWVGNFLVVKSTRDVHRIVAGIQ